jgi:hypothetical protein
VQDVYRHLSAVGVGHVVHYVDVEVLGILQGRCHLALFQRNGSAAGGAAEGFDLDLAWWAAYVVGLAQEVDISWLSAGRPFELHDEVRRYPFGLDVGHIGLPRMKTQPSCPASRSNGVRQPASTLATGSPVRRASVWKSLINRGDPPGSPGRDGCARDRSCPLVTAPGMGYWHADGTFDLAPSVRPGYCLGCVGGSRYASGVIIHCASCNTVVGPVDDCCERCGARDIMVGMVTPSGVRVSAPREAPRIRIQGRRLPGSSRVQYEATVGGPIKMPRRDRSPAAPHLKLYSDLLWNHDRQRLERREMLVDSENDYYQQEWFDLATGERTWEKGGSLSDPNNHGRSARRQ